MTTFDEFERSNYDGVPILLYEFYRESGAVSLYWRYTSADSDQTYDGNTYSATSISDDGIRQNGEPSDSQLMVSMPVLEDFISAFRRGGSTPSDTVWLTIRKVHNGNLADVQVIWKGTVASVSQVDDVKAQVVCNMLIATFKRGGLRLGWGRTCPYVVYSKQCKADPNDFDANGTIDSFTINTVTSVDGFGTQPDQYYAGGFIEWTVDEDGATERRWVKQHIGNTVTIAGNTFGMTVGDDIRAVAGCDLLIKTCRDKFDNLANFGGFIDIPGKSPFSGDPVF